MVHVKKKKFLTIILSSGSDKLEKSSAFEKALKEPLMVKRSQLLDSWFYCKAKTDEPPHDKTNKMAVRLAKSQISLGIRPVWSKSSLS